MMEVENGMPTSFPIVSRVGMVTLVSVVTLMALSRLTTTKTSIANRALEYMILWATWTTSSNHTRVAERLTMPAMVTLLWRQRWCTIQNRVQASTRIYVRTTRRCRVAAPQLAVEADAIPLHQLPTSHGPRRSSTRWEEYCWWLPWLCSLVYCSRTAGEEKPSCNEDSGRVALATSLDDQGAHQASRLVPDPQSDPNPDREKKKEESLREWTRNATNSLFCTYIGSRMLKLWCSTHLLGVTNQLPTLGLPAILIVSGKKRDQFVMLYVYRKPNVKTMV